MSKPNRSAALNAILGKKEDAQVAPVEPLRAEPQPETVATATPAPVEQPRENVVELRQPKPQAAKKAIGKVMLYLPPKVAKKFKEMAFHEDCKAHDIYLRALEDYLRIKGHAAVAELLTKKD